MAYDQDAGDTLALKGANGTVVSNLADGVAAHDAVNKGQMDAGDAATLAASMSYTDTSSAQTLVSANAHADTGDAGTLASANAYADTTANQTLASANAHADTGDADTLASANSYADNTATQTLTSANAYTDTRFSQLNALNDNFEQFRSQVDQRFAHTDRRIDRQGAMSSAMLNMAINAAGSQSRAGRVAVGVGWQAGESALSIGYGKRIGRTGSFSIGGAVSHGEKSAGMGFGIDL